MTQEMMQRIFDDTNYVHSSGTPEELRVAEYLKAQCEALGVPARLEAFPVAMAEMEEAHVYADGREIPCKGFFCCGSGEVEGELCCLSALDPVSVALAKDKIVLLETSGIGFFGYQDLMKVGVKGILFQYGDTHYPIHDIDERDLRAAVVGEEKKVLCAMLHTADAMDLLRQQTKQVKIVIRQREYEGESHNVIAELPGQGDEWIALTAHYDTTSLSHGSYDNMSGCVGILGVLDLLKKLPLRYGLRLVFCGSEERGLLGSKTYTRDHEAELEKIALNVNLDMIGTWLGKFLAKVSGEEGLVHYLRYMSAELSFPVASSQGVYSSDSTPFADKGVPALSFARMAAPSAIPFHCRYDQPDVLSMRQLERDIAFIAEFTRRMAMSAACPVKREIPEKVKTELDEYLFRKRRQ